jgi:putative transposase
MALDQSALLEVLEALKAADVDERVRQAATTIYQALIEAETHGSHSPGGPLGLS